MAETTRPLKLCDLLLNVRKTQPKKNGGKKTNIKASLNKKEKRRPMAKKLDDFSSEFF